MSSYFVRSRKTIWLGAIGAIALIAGCSGSDIGASRLKALHSGMPRDTVLRIMGEGPLTGVRADAARIDHGFRKQAFFIDGRVVEVLWFRTETGDVSELITKERETPVVLTADTLAGWGWKYYQEQAPTLRLPDALRASDSAHYADYQRKKTSDDSAAAVEKKKADSIAAAAKAAKPPGGP